MRKVTGENLPYRADIFSLSGYGLEAANQQPRQAEASVTLAGTTYQACTFWNSSGKLVVGKRTLDAAWTLYTYDGSGGLANITITGGDNHFASTIGIDPDGFIHVSYDHHSSALNYRKSDAAITTWTGALTVPLVMVGTNEGAVTYPTFFNDPAGILYFIFRDESSNNSDWYLYKYAHGTTTWAAATGTSTAGVFLHGTYLPGTDRPYLGLPVFDDDFGSGGFLHFSFKWRASTNGNSDVSYVKWDGSTFKQADGGSQSVPVTHANCEIVDAITDDEGLTAFPDVYSDSGGYPHIVYAKTGGDTYRHLYHTYYNGASWSSPQQLTTTLNPPGIGDNSTTFLGLIPAIVIERATNTVYIIYSEPLESGGITLLKSSDFTTWTKNVVYPFSVGWYNPKYDAVEFERSGNLYLSIEEYHNTITGGTITSFPIYLWKVDPSAIW
jgi:hypothetical protein